MRKIFRLILPVALLLSFFLLAGCEDEDPVIEKKARG